MSLVRLENISKGFSGESLLDKVSFRIEEGERIALIGRNGTGKTTLFRLITGETEPESGVVERMRRARIVYLSQIPDAPPDSTVHDIALGSFTDLLELEQTLLDLEHRLAGEHTEALLAEYGELQHTFALRGGYEFRTRVRQILCGLGFHPDEFNLPFKALSGGCTMQTCCCWTNRKTIWTWKPGNGWKTTCAPGRKPSSSFPMTAAW